MRKRARIALFLTALFATATACAAAQTPPGLKAGDTLLFLGDNITHQCLYTRYVTLFYMTRYPDIPLHFYNSGVGGDRAADALRRFKYDVAAFKPACVTILLGMNDGWYRPLGERQFGIYKRDMTKLVDRLQKETRARIYLLTPSFYDYQARKMRGWSGCPTYNAALIAFGDFLRKLGKERGLPVADLNKPLLDATAALRKTDPKAALTRDGVHPDAAGHLVMAYAILKAFGVTPLVSQAAIDARAGRAQGQRGEVSNVQAKGDEVRFDWREAGLPFPYRKDARRVLSVLPFTRELNREILQVKGLAPGTYELRIDSAVVGRFTAEQLARGVNLSENEKTPQYKQAAKVQQLNDQRTAILRGIRNFRLAEKRRGYPKADGSYPRPPLKRVRAENGKWKWAPAPELVEKFNKMRDALPKQLEQVRALEAQCYQAARPRVHHYRLSRVQ